MKSWVMRFKTFGELRPPQPDQRAQSSNKEFSQLLMENTMSSLRFVKRVVDACLQVRKEDRVSIFAWRHMLDLAEAFAFECRKRGAKTHIEVETDELFYKTLLDLPSAYLRETDPFGLGLLDVATANIFIQGPEDPERLKQVTPERLNALYEANKPYYDKLLERKIRGVEIMLGYVTRQRAKTYGFSYGRWNENIHDAMDVKYDDLRNLGRKIGDMLEKATEARITAANGTDMTLAFEGREARIYDGVIDDEDVNRGAIFAALPAGYVAIVPKERSAIGTYISNVPEADAGCLRRDVAWDFRNGKLASFKGGKNVEGLRAVWEKASGDKDQAAFLMIGVNPKAKEGFMHNQIVRGAVTLGLGDNRELGGKMESNFGFKCTITKPTLELDGRPVIKRGRFVL
jgi:leucyl aminopeptidase (aminopeptidase T)